MSSSHPGGCLCGAVRFVADGEPEAVIACHCMSCRRHTGAPVSVYADYKRDRVAFSAGAPAEYQSSPGAWRGFCSTCGSTLCFRGDNLPDMIHLHIGAFEPAPNFTPVGEVRTETRFDWIEVSLPV